MIKVSVMYPNTPGSRFDHAYYANSHMCVTSSATRWKLSRAGFGPHAQEIMSDIPNYTDIAPVIQISEVVVG